MLQFRGNSERPSTSACKEIQSRPVLIETAESSWCVPLPLPCPSPGSWSSCLQNSMRTAHLQSNPWAGESKQVCAAHQSLKQMRVSKAGTRTEPSLEQGADLPTTYEFFKLAYICICLQGQPGWFGWSAAACSSSYFVKASSSAEPSVESVGFFLWSIGVCWIVGKLKKVKRLQHLQYTTNSVTRINSAKLSSTNSAPLASPAAGTLARSCHWPNKAPRDCSYLFLHELRHH